MGSIGVGLLWTGGLFRHVWKRLNRCGGARAVELQRCGGCCEGMENTMEVWGMCSYRPYYEHMEGAADLCGGAMEVCAHISFQILTPLYYKTLLFCLEKVVT